MTVQADDKFTTPSEVVLLRPGQPAPENALERLKRLIREEAAAAEQKRATAK